MLARAGGQPGLPAKRNLAVILPISGKKCSRLSLASTHGQRVRRIQSEQRASGELVHVELAPGAVTILPAWKLDAIYCAGLTSAPRRFPWRRSAHCTSCSTPANQGWSPRTATSSRRRRRMEGQLPLARRTELACRHTALRAPRQLDLVLDDVRFQAMTAAERRAVLRAMARLLLEAGAIEGQALARAAGLA
jgi:hypothetical protein